jgi:hypothetical protein
MHDALVWFWPNLAPVLFGEIVARKLGFAIIEWDAKPMECLIVRR